MKIAIIGYGIQGQSSYNYWNKDNEITICDKNDLENIPSDAKVKIGDDYLKNLDEYDLIIRSPSVYPEDIIQANNESIIGKITTNTNEFFKVCPTKNIIGVTGTKGKGTTSTLITKMLEKDGKIVHLGGNIGIPPLELLRNNIKNNDWVVLELANFQLIDLKYSPHIGVCLMIAEEHLDWHKSIDDYLKAKKQLFAHQKVKDIAIYYADNPLSKEIAELSLGQKIPYFKSPGAHQIGGDIYIEDIKICDIHDIKLLGNHNRENICAAITAVWEITKNQQAIVEAIREFTGLANRLELVRTINRVSFYNDSFASAPDAAIASIRTITTNKIMIIGGFDRNLNLDNLVNAIKENSQTIKKVLLIGQSRIRVAAFLDNIYYNNYKILESKNMEEIVKEANAIAQPGDSIVLSPGFPSFDMFKNFEQRGEEFKQAVINL